MKNKFVFILKVGEDFDTDTHPDPDPLVRGTDPEHWFPAYFYLKFEMVHM